MDERAPIPSGAATEPTPLQRAQAYAVHVYTAAGVAFAFAAATEICSFSASPRAVLLLLFIAVLIDATDGIFARRWHVKRWAPAIDGRVIDDLVDYLTYTFLPLLLIWRMNWVPDPAELWIIPALIASLFGFANANAKDEANGFFLGFPSYWNVAAFYAGFAYFAFGSWFNAALLLALTALTFAPVRFIYPNLVPRRWRVAVLGGAAAWIAILLVLLLKDFPRGPHWLVWLSLVYPAFYTALSLHLHRRTPQIAQTL